MSGGGVGAKDAGPAPPCPKGCGCTPVWDRDTRRKRGGYWRCSEVKRKRKRVENMKPERIEIHHERERKRKAKKRERANALHRRRAKLDFLIEDPRTPPTEVAAARAVRDILTRRINEQSQRTASA